MTICVSVKVAEGLVLAADSATMLQGTIKTPQGDQTAILQTFDFANKVSRVKDYPIGIMSWGIGSISDRSIQSLVMEFEYGYSPRAQNKDFTVVKLAESFLDFIRPRYEAAYPQSPAQRPSLGLLVGGYSAKKFFPEAFVHEFPKSKAWENVRPDGPNGRPSFGANWFGLTDALIRLIKGYDPEALNELVRRGADKRTVLQWVKDQVSELRLVFDGMPLQDAIDFAEYAVQVVIGRYRFGIGPPLCGGDIDIAVITPGSFQWAKRKQWAIKE